MNEHDKELQMALLQLDTAYNQFNYCDPEFIDYCILQIESAKARVSAIITNNKKGTKTDEKINHCRDNNTFFGMLHRVCGTDSRPELLSIIQRLERQKKAYAGSRTKK